MKALKSLYNGILNDYSIRRYSLGWSIIVEKIERRYKSIPRTDEQFENKLIINALSVSKGSLQKDIKFFAKELELNIKTLNNKGTPRSPFDIGS